MHNDSWTNNTHNWGYLWLRWTNGSINIYGRNSFNTANTTFNNTSFNLTNHMVIGTPEEYIFVVRSGEHGRGDNVSGTSITLSLIHISDPRDRG